MSYSFLSQKININKSARIFIGANCKGHQAIHVSLSGDRISQGFSKINSLVSDSILNENVLTLLGLSLPGSHLPHLMRYISVTSLGPSPAAKTHIPSGEFVCLWGERRAVIRY